MDPSMMRLRDVESRLPPGFRFHPSDEELVFYYLRSKQMKMMSTSPPAVVTMVEVDLHVREPWELPEEAKLSDIPEWYFLSFRDRKYATGSRRNRATKHGYWKATGKDKVIIGREHEHEHGMRKTLVFYLGRAPHGRKSDWVMHEFRLVVTSTTVDQSSDWVLCRVFHKGHDGGGGSLCSPPPQPADNLDGQLFPITVSSSSPITTRMPILQKLAAPDAGFDISSESTPVANGQMVMYGENCMQEMPDMVFLEGGDYCYF